MNWVRAKRSSRPAAHHSRIRQEPVETRGGGRRRPRRISNLRRFFRPLRRPTQFASRILQPRTDLDVSRRRPKRAPLTLHFSHVPAGWKIATPLKSSDDEFTADNYDLCRRFSRRNRDLRGIGLRRSRRPLPRHIRRHDPADYDAAKIVAALHKIVVGATTWMNDRPFDSYMFLYHFPRGPAGGGMEHALFDRDRPHRLDSLQAESGKLSDRRYCSRILASLEREAHPSANSLEPVDYTKENYTRALWFSEGVTSTAEGVIQLRAGMIDEEAVSVSPRG